MRTQRGVSLVELMVSITIGMFLLLGVGTIYVSISQTSQLRKGLSALQDHERMAMTFMQSSIQGAGFYPSTVASGVVTTNAVSAFPATGSFTTSGQALVGADGAANTDTLSVRFIADPTNTSAFQGCSAAPVANTLYTDVFSIDTVNQNLICTENGTQYTLIVGVSGVNILYGVDAPSGSSGSVTQYLTATNVTASLGYWNYVKTVQLTLLFTNPLAGQPGQPATISLSQTIPYMASL